MNKVLIVSATKGENYTLAKKIYDLCDSDICKKYISLEDYDLPLFKASNYDQLKLKYEDEIKSITDELVDGEPEAQLYEDGVEGEGPQIEISVSGDMLAPGEIDVLHDGDGEHEEMMD